VSTIPGAYNNKRIHLHNLDWDREITGYTSARLLTVTPPFPYNPPIGTNITIYDGDALTQEDGEWYNRGLPAFHVRVNPITDTSSRTIHAALTREASLQFAGGLSATYYTLTADTGQMQRPLFATACTYGRACDETIDFSLATNYANTKQLVKSYGEGVMGSETVRGWHEEYCIPTLRYGVRWSGFISPSAAGEYSFMLRFSDSQPGPDDRVKLWIDNTLVIHQWTSLYGAGLTLAANLMGGGTRYEIGLQGTFFFPRAFPEPYPISIMYKNLDANSVSGARLSWQSAALGSNESIPVPSSRLYPLSGRHHVTYTASTAGDYQLLVSAAQGHGLDATFYSDTELTMPLLAKQVTSIDFDAANEAFLAGRASSFSVRWAGLLQIGGAQPFDDTNTDVFTFETALAERDERVKLWVDNSLIIDRWYTYGTLLDTVFSATISLQRAFYHDLKMEYRQDGGNAAKLALRWKCGVAAADCSTATTTPISSSHLFLVQDVQVVYMCLLPAVCVIMLVYMCTDTAI
jgi:hypothetical protein